MSHLQRLVLRRERELSLGHGNNSEQCNVGKQMLVGLHIHKTQNMDE